MYRRLLRQHLRKLCPVLRTPLLLVTSMDARIGCIQRSADIELVNTTMEEVDEFAAKGECEMMLPRTNRFLALALRQRISERHPALTVEKRTSAGDPDCEDLWVVKPQRRGPQAAR